MQASSITAEVTSFPKPAIEPAWSDWEPAMELYDDATALNLILELPGVPPHTLCIAQTAHALVVTGLRPLHLDPGAQPHMEADYGRFSRRVDLPANVNPALREVTVWRGLLIIRLPKSNCV
jgi:HSP20 family molecular chaperone IbpA